MINRLEMFILTINVILSFCFCSNSFADTVLIKGDTDILNILTYTKYLDDKPVLIFSEQMEEMKVNLLNKIDNIMFCDNAWQDLAVEFAIQSVIVNPRSTIKIEKDGIYEMFVYSPQSKIYSLHLEIEIDGKKILQVTSFKSQVLGRKYLNIGECELKIGKHKIQLLGLSSKFLGQKESKKLKFLLINKQERQRAEKIIWQRINEGEFEIAYIFSRDGKFYTPEGESYTLKVRLASAFTKSKKNIDKILANKPLLKIDGRQFYIGDQSSKKGIFDSHGFWFKLENVNLIAGEHKLELLSGDNFNTDLLIIEPVTNNQKQLASQETKIIFKKINPTKYLIKVENAQNPFWLVFSESFHKEWRIYSLQSTIPISTEFNEIIADYTKLGVKEARHKIEFTPLDIKYLFRKPITDNHYLANGYANGWYIDPKELGLGKDFILVLYFWPQSLFYLGLVISGLTFLSSIGYLTVNFIEDRLKRRFKERL